MTVIPLKLEGLKLVKTKVFQDNRGYFLESYHQEAYRKHGIPEIFVQDNHSYSSKGCIRGMHFQAKPGQAKLVRVAHGEIFDVAVDIRPDSPTFGQWEGVILSGENHDQLYIPVGFAHGFCVLSETAHVLYKVSTAYDPAEEKGFRWDDPRVAIPWPVKDPIVSPRDMVSPYMHEIITR
jgi:dTDP-4-dehydrorhamnose 3,5-epimerase